jgi:hypothetical protein
LRNSDLFLFQEVVHEETKASIADEVTRSLGYFSEFDSSAPGVCDQGLGLVSRYPISGIEKIPLKSCDLGFRNRQRFAFPATVHTPWVDLGVRNVHLDTRVNAAERPRVTPAISRSTPRMSAGVNLRAMSCEAGLISSLLNPIVFIPCSQRSVQRAARLPPSAGVFSIVMIPRTVLGAGTILTRISVLGAADLTFLILSDAFIHAGFDARNLPRRAYTQWVKNKTRRFSYVLTGS